MSDNAAAHVSIKISVPGGSLTLHRVPLAGRRTLALPAPGTAFAASITISDESGNHVVEERSAP